MTVPSRAVQTFVAQIVGAVEDLALLFAGHPNEAVEATLAEACANMRADFMTHYPNATDWDALLDQFAQFVWQRKAELEFQTKGAGHDRAH
jgi:hypothetical protein